MKVSVFLSNSSIQVVLGEGNKKKAVIRSLFSDDIPDGTLLNGTVINESALEDTIRETWSRHGIKEKNVDLVINSPHLMARRIEMPLMNGAKAEKYISNEADEKDIARFNNAILGWYPVSKKGNTQLVISEMAEKEFVETYIRIFEASGVKLNSLHGGINLAVNMMQTQVGNDTVVYMILDGMTLTTILFAKGTYYNRMNTRIYAAPGTMDFSMEIRNAISSIQQFATAQHIEEKISDIYIAGLNAGQMENLKTELQGYPIAEALKPMVCPGSVEMNFEAESFGDYLFSIAGFFGTRDGLSLLEALKKDSEQYRKQQMILKMAIPYAAAVVVLAILSFAILISMLSKKSELEKLRAYNNRPEIVEAAAAYDALSMEAARLGRAQGSVDLLKEYRETYPTPDSSVNQSIIGAAREEEVEIVFNSYAAETGVLELTAKAEDVEKINRFIAGLMAIDTFELIDYTGYTKNEADNTWSINVICTLAEG
ncbi:MAG: hypothetical protein IJ600_00345 [Lachnospiraceae bacterium]|nr:hypothetical protein [Lachnospiraceae bacterium]